MEEKIKEKIRELLKNTGEYEPADRLRNEIWDLLPTHCPQCNGKLSLKDYCDEKYKGVCWDCKRVQFFKDM